jgi:hypothetical protein
MTPHSPEARKIALRLLARGGAIGDAACGSDCVTATQHMFRQLAGDLTRWFGPFGFHALFARALTEAKRQHPALGSVQIRSAVEPTLDGLAEGVAEHGSDAVTEGIIAMLMAFIDLLSRLIGEDMALTLLDRPVPTRGSPPREPGNEGAP